MILRAHNSATARLGAAIFAAAAGGAWCPALAADPPRPPAPPPPPIGIPEPVKQADATERIEDAGQISPTFERLVAELGSPNFAIRQQASERIGANEQFTLEMMEGVLARKDLSLEARYRLSSIARQRFYRTPRAALGFRFGEQLRDPAVVGETFPPFPAARLLEPGDLIVRADGIRLDGPAAKPLLQAIIISHDPGETLHLVIRRGAKKMEIDAPLGKFVDLGQGGGMLPEDRLARAWRFRLQNRMGGVAEPVRVEGTAADWASAMDDAQRKAEAAMRRDVNESSVKFVGGGMPRAAQGGDDSRLFDPIGRQQFAVINGQVRMMNMPAFRNAGIFGLEADPDAGLPPVRAEEQLAKLLEMKQAYQHVLGNVDPDTLPASDTRRAELLDLKKKIAVISKQYDAIQAEHDEAREAAGKLKPAGGTMDATVPPAP
jgi:hypothetical protein